jgi:manganese transport system substrate-binding protein
VALLAVVALVLAGCGGDDRADGAADDRPVVLTTFTVLADMVRNVAGDRAEVASVVKVGGEIHGYEPTPSDLTTATRADLVIQNGLGLERWIEQFTDQVGVPEVVLGEGVETIPIAGTGEYGGKPNPHVWMSARHGAAYVEAIRDALIDLDPDGADTYRANAERYAAEVLAVGEEVRAALAELPAPRRALVTCEGAFSYLAADLGLDEAFLWPVNAEQEGTPQQIASVVGFVRDRGVPAVFCESTVSDRAQRQVAAESGSRFAGTLYVDSLSAADGPVPTYLDLLRHDASVIVAGLTGAA